MEGKMILKKWLSILLLTCCLPVAVEAKSALVTGGCGFLGSHMCDRLIERGYDVTCTDNLQTGSCRNIAHHVDNPHFSYVRHDVEQQFPDSWAFDEIYNFACPASPPKYQIDPIKTLRTNVLGIINVLELAKRCGAKVFHASTSEVYGDPLVHPQPESYWGNVNPTGIRACYDEGKRCAETLCFDYWRMHGVDIKVARIFNTYGPRMSADDGRIVSNMIVQAIQGKPMTVYGDGSQTRSFCYVSDLVDGIEALMHTGKDFQGPVNLGNPEEYTVLGLAEKVLRLSETTSEIVFKPLPLDDPRQRKPDISLAKEKLKWAPTVNVDEGLRRTYSHFKQILNP